MYTKQKEEVALFSYCLIVVELRPWMARCTLQITLDLCIPEKELAKTPSQISFIYFQSHS
jgi:hypothetical protein